MTRFDPAAVAAGTMALLALGTLGCIDPVIGAECRPEFVQCGHECCDNGQACVADRCVVPGDAGPADSGDAGSGEECPIGWIFCDGECVRPDVDPRHCGGCLIGCAAGAFCVDFECRDDCPAPRVECGGRCVDPSTDPEDCGSCGVACETGVCVDRSCGGSSAVGHVVVIGHDYRASNAAQDVVVGNAVLIPLVDPLRLVQYVGAAPPASAVGVDRAVDQVSARDGQVVIRMTVDRAGVPAALAMADTFLIHTQPGVSDADLRRMGIEWGRAMVGLLRRGGTIVVIDAGGANGGTHQILEPSGLFDARSRSGVGAGTRLGVADLADAVSPALPVGYPAAAESASFERPTGNVVVREADAPYRAVVLHRALTTGSAP